MPEQNTSSYELGRFWKQFGSQINTLLLIVTILGVGYTYATKEQSAEKAVAEVSSQVEKLGDAVKRQDDLNTKKWEEHQELHKDRQSEIAAQSSAASTRISLLEQDLRKFDELSYKQTQTETNVTTLQSSIKELSNTVNTQSTNLQVMQQILQRIETKVTQGGPRN